MLKITVLCPSSLLSESSIESLISEYLKRIDYKVEFKNPKVKVNKNDSDDLVKQKQGQAIIDFLDKQSNTAVIALDEHGKNLNSVDFAKMVEQQQVEGVSHIVFVIGGAFGLSSDVLKQCHIKLSFGKMVWPHKFVGLMLIEQIYRAQQILKGHPYHKA
jgi:23S rRNA (pseudouridine1915-N3)-methyltransferase